MCPGRLNTVILDSATSTVTLPLSPVWTIPFAIKFSKIFLSIIALLHQYTAVSISVPSRVMPLDSAPMRFFSKVSRHNDTISTFSTSKLSAALLRFDVSSIMLIISRSCAFTSGKYRSLSSNFPTLPIIPSTRSIDAAIGVFSWCDVARIYTSLRLFSSSRF